MPYKLKQSADPSTEYGDAREGHDDGPPLLLGRKLEIGGYGGLDVAYSRMFGRDGALVGVQGALLLDHRLSLGLAGYGWTNSQSAPPDAAGNPQRFETGYGFIDLMFLCIQRNQIWSRRRIDVDRTC
jgi:hypothetical protein